MQAVCRAHVRAGAKTWTPGDKGFGHGQAQAHGFKPYRLIPDSLFPIPE